MATGYSYFRAVAGLARATSQHRGSPMARHGRLTARRNEPNGGVIFELSLPQSAASLTE